jgi:hypothetical protein
MLLIDAKAVHERLQGAQSAQANLAEAQALANLQKSLAGKAAAVRALVGRRALLAQRGVPLSTCPDCEAMRKTIASLRMRFDQAPTSTTLTQGKHWSSLMTALDTAIATVETTQRNDWSAYVANSLFAGLPPERRKVGLVQTPDNKAALNRYTRLYEKFARYRNTIPVTAQALDEVHQYSADLAEIVFEEDVPQNVEAFINALAFGASLELLTPEVIAWLREHDLLGSYVVRARV